MLMIVDSLIDLLNKSQAHRKCVDDVIIWNPDAGDAQNDAADTLPLGGRSVTFPPKFKFLHFFKFPVR